MTKMTRVEQILRDGHFGAGVTRGMRGGATVRVLLSDARALQRSYRAKLGYSGGAKMLTSGSAQVKLGKNARPSYGLMLTPERGMMAHRDVLAAFDLSGPFNLCPMASKGCAAACLSRSGQSGMKPAQRAQAVRTAFLLAFPFEAGLLIGAEIRNALKRSARINLRLNTTSDIRWEKVAPRTMVALDAAGVKLYDYTAWKATDRDLIAGYSLTHSAKEASATPDEYLDDLLRSGRNVAVPFTTGRGKALPETWRGWRVIDGDVSDERYRDPRGVVVGLRAKGHEWKRDNSAGFIRQAN